MRRFPCIDNGNWTIVPIQEKPKIIPDPLDTLRHRGSMAVKIDRLKPVD